MIHPRVALDPTRMLHSRPERIVKRLTTHQPRSIRTIAWNPTGHLIATGSSDRSIRIWNPDKPQVKNSTELRGHTGAIQRVAWNPTKEAELASVSSDGTCRFWDVKTRTCIATIQLGDEGVTVGWASDGSLALVVRRVGPPSPSYLTGITSLARLRCI